MREDLALRFNQTMESMQKSLWKKERALPQMYNLTPQIAFHGTRATSLPSIGNRDEGSVCVCVYVGYSRLSQNTQNRRPSQISLKLGTYYNK